ncbi:MAG TPA: penicillin-binding protein 2 [Steroidobacteraceae bacterium]|nr:penicillin-binding protein 2 [Steroidobacteraceae bacterium]
MRRVRIKDEALEQRIFFRRVLVAAAVVAAISVALAGRAFWLQVVQHAHYVELSQGNRARIEPLPPNRGIIYDRAGRVIAENTPAYQLELIREQAGDLEDALGRLVRFGLLEQADVARVRQLALSRRSFEAVPFLLQLDDEEVARYAVHRHELPGVLLETRMARHYPFGPVGAHALGYVGTISEQDLSRVDREKYFGTGVIGKTGVEHAYEPDLLGIGGYREVLVNAEGRPVLLAEGEDPELRVHEPQAGRGLRLTLDIELERVAEEAFAGRRGGAVAIDPTNGDVLVFASMPSFDPNGFARGISRSDYLALTENPDQPLFNRVLRGTYPPGSTVKPLMALAGLENDVIRPEDHVYCPGSYSLPGSRHRFRDFKREGHGSMDMENAVMQSCDVYFYRLANTLGIERIHDSMTRMGFGQATGIDIAGERGGIMPSPAWKKTAFAAREQQVWFPGETVIVGIGQGYWTATLLQLAKATALLATRGQPYRPRLVRALVDPATGRAEEREPEPLPRIELKYPENWEIIVNAMVAVTSGPRGTAQRAARGATYSIAGKTGTAQVFSVGQTEKYDEKEIAERLRDHALFVAFAPAESPRLAVAVLVENGGFGASAAAPIARAIFDAYLAPGQPK